MCDIVTNPLSKSSGWFHRPRIMQSYVLTCSSDFRMHSGTVPRWLTRSFVSWIRHFTPQIWCKFLAWHDWFMPPVTSFDNRNRASPYFARSVRSNRYPYLKHDPREVRLSGAEGVWTTGGRFVRRWRRCMYALASELTDSNWHKWRKFSSRDNFDVIQIASMYIQLRFICA